MDWKTLFLSVEGRIGSKDFFVGIALLFVVGLVINQIEAISWLWNLASIYFMVCVYGKRLHDIGQSAWLVLLPLGMIIVVAVVAGFLGGAALFGGAATGSSAAMIAGGAIGALLLVIVPAVLMLATLGWVIWLGTRPGEPADNRFGPARTVPLVTAF